MFSFRNKKNYPLVILNTPSLSGALDDVGFVTEYTVANF